MKKVEVVAAIIVHNNEFFCVQRPESKLPYISKKFEFPGGKIEVGETQKEALQRELMEELNLQSEIGDLFLTVNHTYPDFEITMHSYICEVNSRDIDLNEHISLKWLTKNELNQLDWAKADVPIVNKLMNDRRF